MVTGAPIDKPTLRRRMRLVRELVDDRLLRSVSLWADVAALPAYSSSTTVMGFVGIDGEPDTDPFFARLERDGKQIVLPAMEEGRIVPRLVGDGLVRGAHGVPSPQGPPVSLEELSLVVVPGVAFTLDGGRLGRGGGHYDRFLAALQGPCLTVGVCFTEQLVDDLPLEPHDVRVGRVIVA